MATWAGGYVGIGSQTGCRARIETSYSTNHGGNYSTINWNLYADFVNSTAQLDDGTVNGGGGQRWRNGGRIYNYPGSWSSRTIHIAGGSFTVGHDANGNGSYGMDANFYVYQSGRAYASGSEGLPRLGGAPGGISKSVDTITSTSARLGRKQDNHGRGTSSANRVYYRLNNTGGWSETPDQGGTGWKYNTVSIGSNSTYGYFSRHWNNNGDSADTGTSTFVTLPASCTASGFTPDNTSFTANVSQDNGGNARVITKEYRVRVQGGTWGNWIVIPASSISHTGLAPNTTYEVQLRSSTADGTTEGSTHTIKTLASGGVTSVNPLKYNKATVNVGMNASGSSESNATVKVQYKRSVDSTWLDSSTSTSMTPAFLLTGIKANTVYDYRIVATNSSGTWTGGAGTFKTKNAPGFIFIMEDF